MTNKERFIEIVKSTIKRDGIDNLLSWLENSDFFVAPASTKFHGAYEGGLLEHTLNVYDEAVELADYYQINTSEESLAISTLFHDLCKVNVYKKTIRNVKENGLWTEKQVYEFDEQLPFGYHADKSIILLQSFIRLKADEIYAIRAHMGGYDSAIQGGDRILGKIFDISPLAVIVHIADIASSHLLEK